ncbi:hypothetical protein SAMN05421504_101399 [Amycolatopsis xylanica]|uniref:Uncharacterized protein n=1 Tax=Amycolatopsis xylanica TaxID=589385 RepID=A0A1H2SZ17_9PSEU|nr:hypothetical protein SAMN05421504_101399 [Amycolatopsis xylanica]
MCQSASFDGDLVLIPVDREAGSRYIGSEYWLVYVGRVRSAPMATPTIAQGSVPWLRQVCRVPF